MTVLLVLAAVAAGVGVVSAWLDPRKIRIGVYFLVAITLLALASIAGLVGAVGEAATRPDDPYAASEAQAWVIIVLLSVGLVSIITVAGFLLMTGVLVVRREGRSVAHALALLTGVGILGYLALGLWALARSEEQWFVLLMLLAFPIGYLGFGLLAYLLWSRLYDHLAWLLQRRPVAAVIVLGAGLAGGERVTPLLASRIDTGLREWRRWRERGASPTLVLSGGKGPDERISEGRAMAIYAAEAGVGVDVLVEEASRTTEENLRFSRALLASQGDDGPVAVATSNFHAFRAALLLRRLGWPGYAVGGRTAGYYWPTAFLREYVAVLRDHVALTVVGLGVSLLPLLGAVLLMLASL